MPKRTAIFVLPLVSPLIKSQHEQVPFQRPYKAHGMLGLISNEHSECLQQSMIKVLSFFPIESSVLTFIDRIFEEALDHVILGNLVFPTLN